MTVVVLADSDFDDLELERTILGDAGIGLVVADSAAAHDLGAAAPDAEGLLVQWGRADAAVMDRLPRLRAIGRFGTGVDQIDVAEATRRGIAVVNSGHYATEEVAAHTAALVLALVRRLPRADRSIREGRWEPLAAAAGIRRLSELTAGVIGLGHIGRLVGRHLTALGMRVIGYDPATAGPPAGIDVAASLEELLRASDVVTTHVPLLPETTHLLDRDRLRLLPLGAIVVNTARGGIVDERALCEALAEGRLAGAALDVFEEEPIAAASPLLEFPNVILTPHIAYYSQQSLREARRRTVESLAAALRGEPVRDLVNPEHAGRQSVRR